MALNITKGDWKLLEGVKPEYNGHVIVSVEYGANLAYAETFDVDPVEAEANAHLIAASPKLYEALEKVGMLYAEYMALKPAPLTESWELVQSIVREVDEALSKAVA